MKVGEKIGVVALTGFIILIILCSFTIIANALWLDSLSTNMLIIR